MDGTATSSTTWPHRGTSRSDTSTTHRSCRSWRRRIRPRPPARSWRCGCYQHWPGPPCSSSRRLSLASSARAHVRAQPWAAFGLLLSPLFLGSDLMFQTVAFDEVVWAVALLVFVRLLGDGERRLWLVLGLVVGVGLETKFTIAALPVAMFLGLLVTQRRAMLLTPWPWLGAASPS